MTGDTAAIVDAGCSLDYIAIEGGDEELRIDNLLKASTFPRRVCIGNCKHSTKSLNDKNNQCIIMITTIEKNECLPFSVLRRVPAVQFHGHLTAQQILREPAQLLASDEHNGDDAG